MNKKKKTIDIICDNEDCRTKYVLSMSTLRAATYVTITCKKCGDIQQIKLNENGGIEIDHVR
jgi:RNase P subunit RPR2